MERNKTIVSIFLVLLILVVTVITPISAVTLSFVDKAYMQGNDYVITDNTGSTVANFTGSSSAILNQGKSYSVLFKPNGLFSLAKEGPSDYSSLGKLGTFLLHNASGLIIIGLILGFIALRRH
jgi:maltodextrin utilization protein YvdJ